MHSTAGRNAEVYFHSIDAALRGSPPAARSRLVIDLMVGLAKL